MHKKALITGSAGFVGPYLKAELVIHGYDVFGLDRGNKEEASVFCGDIRDPAFVDQIIEQTQPDEIYHLAGFSSVRKSFDEPALTREVNVEGTRNILKAVRQHAPKAKVLIVSSAHVYGKPGKVPINENEPVKETSPYSQSRIEQEGLMNEFGDLHIVISRSFDHTGPGQQPIFVLPDFTRQAVEIEKDKIPPIIFTGNLDVIRDFSDVRDVVKAYYLLLQKGKKNGVYNVGSGQGYKISDLLKKIIARSKKPIEIRQDPLKLRPVDIPELVADISKIKTDTGWAPNYTIDNTLEDLLNYWRQKP
ncbi:GDP-mannose 4,6-dehydratase [Candidatus Peregrinibacteria bacterium]|nr:GDP-mannose 4,6-dehydratase [Candidatus Peregrinibacteria bacterium]